MPIHPSSIIADGAVIPASCTVGPFCTIGPNVILGEDCELISHVVLDGRTKIGDRVRIFSFAVRRHRAAGPEVQGRTHRLRDRCRHRHPRIRHHLARD